MRSDVSIEMAFSVRKYFLNHVAIMLTTAGTLHVNGQIDIQTAEQAAKALEPLVKSFPYAGQVSQMIFALGIIGTGLLAIPVLARSSAYALSDTFGWKKGLYYELSKFSFLALVTSCKDTSKSSFTAHHMIICFRRAF
jgi:Mn2+/Fe2+ NRAMP family transporter